jgi:hypothetical protein
MTCSMRVPDHTDFDDCGKPTLPGHTYCIEHRVEELARLRKQMEVAADEAYRAETAYLLLLNEGQ